MRIAARRRELIESTEVAVVLDVVVEMVSAATTHILARVTSDTAVRRDIQRQLDVLLKRIDDQLDAGKVALASEGLPSMAFAHHDE